MIFATATLASLSVVYLIVRRRGQSRLQEVLDDSLNASIEEVGGRAHRAGLTTLRIKWLDRALRRHRALMLPQGRWEESYLRSKLVMAGFRRQEALTVFFGSRIFLAILLPAFLLIARFFIQIGTLQLMLLNVALAALGFYLPLLYLNLRIKTRQRRIARALPNALDMMVVCVEAGLGLDAAVQRVGEEMEMASPELCEEFRLSSLELRAGKSRIEAFRNIGNRTGVDDMKSLTALLVQTDRFGTSVANALRVHADSMRTKRRQRLEEMAAKTSVKLVFPLVLFIFPAILVVVVGPAILQIVRVLFPALGGR
jgi:tight adherence protein C